MISARATSLFIAIIVWATAAQANVPIIVETGVSRRTVMKLCSDASDQLRKGDIADAKRNVDEALRIDPKLWPALYVRAQIFRRQGKYELAVQDCNEALRQYPGFVEAALLRASIYVRLGKYAEASKEFNYLVSIHPRSVTLARVLSDRAWFAGDLPKRIVSQWATGSQRREGGLQHHGVEGRKHDRYACRSLCRDWGF